MTECSKVPLFAKSYNTELNISFNPILKFAHLSGNILLKFYLIMIIYNVTSNIDTSIHNQWLNWIKEHIPQVLATGHFTEAKLTKVLVDDQSGSVTYSVQYRAISREALENYYTNDADRLRHETFKQFGDKVLAFRTELEVIDEYSVKFNWFSKEFYKF